MRQYDAASLHPLLGVHGRTRYVAEKNALFFDWTCAGFTVTFTGTTLRGRVLALGDRMPFPPDAPVDLPVVATAAEDGELTQRFPLREGENDLVLFSGEAGEHTLRLVKLSENMRGKAALLSLETDGELLPVSLPKRLQIEFVGDSITCGFGNEAPGRDSLFDTREENGWLTFGAVCARELGAEFNMVSVSGISTGAAKYPLFPGKNMEDVYEYTDVYCDERLGLTPEVWDFEAHRKDVVVVNLGTNDSSRIWSYKELARADEETGQFRDRYRAFLETLRRRNGPEALIVCTLGPLDYFLYNEIEKTVAQYCADTGDTRVATFKLIGVNLMTEGFGAVSHPSAKTQLRMGKELAERLRPLI